MALIASVPTIGLVGFATLGASAATDDPTGVGLTVTVVGPTGSATPAAPAAAATPASTSTSTPRPAAKPPVVAGVTQVTAKGPAEATHALGTDPTDIDGVFYVSGVSLQSDSDIGPGGGSVSLAFTLKNVTSAPITSNLKFALKNALGFQLASYDNVEVADLGPGETRTVTATIADAGQWTLFTGEVTLTPPPEIRGTVLGPVSRDSLMLLPPVFALLVLAGAGVFALALRYQILTRRLATALRGEVAS